MTAEADALRRAGRADMTVPMLQPPLLDTEDGRPRMIGVEVEFSGLTCEESADLVRDLFGGRIRCIDPYRFEVVETCFGSFTVELDTHYAHPPEDDRPADGSDWEEIRRAVRDGLSSAIGAVSSLWLPVEIVSPPMRITDLPELDRLVPALRKHGALGTRDGLVYAFATQLNPEVPSLRHESVLLHLKAFLLLADALRAEVDMDLLRRALPFADPFPASYVRKVVDPRYWPDLQRFLNDYLDASPTRNRELDLLPLLAHLAPDAVRDKVADVLVKARPTFHYRLPDTRLCDPSWSLIVEWNRWAEVEHLAADRATLDRLGQASLAASQGNSRSRLPADLITAWRAERTAGR
jgi:hypothetical protein